MLSNINSRGLPKSKKVEVLSHPGATGRDMVDKIGGALDNKPESFIFHVATNDLRSDTIFLTKTRKLSLKQRRNHLTL